MSTQNLQNSKYQICLNACNACAESCELCATSCLREQDVKMLEMYSTKPGLCCYMLDSVTIYVKK